MNKIMSNIFIVFFRILTIPPVLIMLTIYHLRIIALFMFNYCKNGGLLYANTDNDKVIMTDIYNMLKHRYEDKGEI